jgi:RNA recognition motif-containing protein
MNVPYDVSTKELEELVGNFVPVEMAVIPRDRAGLPKGYAFVYL